jgi:hypothetical protein
MTMRFPSGAALAAVAALIACVAPAHADNYPVRDGAGATQSFCSKLVGGLQYPCHLIYGLFGSTPTPVSVDSSGNVNVNVQSTPLATGASTSANQTSQITQETATAAALGTTADSAWSGSGVGTLVSIDKAIRNAVAGTLTVQFPSAQAVTQSGSWTFGGNVGGYSFHLGTGGAVSAITVQNAAYSAGNSEGGLITLTGAARTNGGSGTLVNLRLKSNGGSTNTIWVYAWSKQPSTTCTDKSAFVSNNADSPYALPGFPISVTLSNPGSWETGTYGQLTGLNAPFKNQDSSPGTALYFCLVTGGAVTPGSTSDLSLVADGFQD